MPTPENSASMQNSPSIDSGLSTDTTSEVSPEGLEVYAVQSQKRQAKTAVTSKQEDEQEDEQNDDLVKEVLDLLGKGKTEIDSAADQDVVVVLGATGSGKSTTINYLCGCTMELLVDKDTGEKSIISKNAVTAIGAGVKSKTLYPSILTPLDDLNIKFCDTPGLRDNRGVQYDICASFTIGGVFQKAKSIQGILVIIELNHLTDPRLLALSKTFLQLNKLFADSLKYTGSLLFIITKVMNGERTEKQLYNLLCKRKKELEEAKTVNNFDQISWLFDEMVRDNGKQLRICNPLEPKERLEHVNAIKSLQAVRDTKKAFGYPVSDRSLVILNQTIAKKKEQVGKALNTFRELYKKAWLDLIERYNADTTKLHQIKSKIKTLRSDLKNNENWTTSDFMCAIVEYELGNEVKKKRSEIEENLEIVQQLNHFSGKDDDGIVISKALKSNFITNFNELDNNINDKLSPIYTHELENILGTYEIQAGVLALKKALDSALKKSVLSISDLMPIVDKMAPSNKQRFKEICNQLNDLGDVGKSDLLKAVKRYIESPFPYPVADSIKNGQRMEIYRNEPNIALSQVLQVSKAYLHPNASEVVASGIVIFTKGTLYLDSDLKTNLVSGKNVVIGAATVEIMNGDRKINVSGRQGKPPGPKPEVPRTLNEKGQDGKDGDSGKSAGNIYILADKFSGHKLTLIANGGSGGKGQDGGDGAKGAKGADGKDAVSPKHFGDFLDSGPWRLNKGTFGNQGHQGGQGGNAGHGGPGGKAGEIKFVKNNQTSHIICIPNNPGSDGPNGTPGKGGAGGDGGYHGYSILAEKSMFGETHWYKGYLMYNDRTYHTVEGDYRPLFIMEPSTKKNGGNQPPKEGPPRKYANKGPQGNDGGVNATSQPASPEVPGISVEQIKQQYIAFLE